MLPSRNALLFYSLAKIIELLTQHGLSTIGVTLATDINLLSVTFVALIAVLNRAVN